MKQQRKKPKHRKEQAIAIAWYTPEQFDILRQVAADWDNLEETYEKWEKSAQNALRILQQSGYLVKTVDVDVAELVAWCKARRRPLDGEARADYIEEKLEQQQGRRR